MTTQALVAKYWPEVSASVGESQRVLFENAIEEAHHQGWMAGWAERSKADEPEATLPPHTVKDIPPDYLFHVNAAIHATKQSNISLPDSQQA